MIRAIVFDFDGLILETEGPQYEVYRDLYAEHGFELRVEAWERVLGMPPGSCDFLGDLVTLAQRAGNPLDRDELREIYRQRAWARLALEQLRPGVQQWLDDARQRGIRLAIASGSPRNWVERHLGTHGLDGVFQTLVCAEDTATHKPGPEPFAEAARRLDAAPHETIGLEDSPNGVASAKAAGLFTIAVPSDFTRQFDLSAADLVIDSLASVTLAEAIERIDAARAR